MKSTDNHRSLPKPGEGEGGVEKLQTIVIRPATPQDAPHIATIKIESWRSAYAHIINPQTLANLNHTQETQKFLDRIQNQEHILVATNKDNQTVAYSLWIQLQSHTLPQGEGLREGHNTKTASLTVIQSDWPYPNMLASLYCLPAHTGQGIGTTLIRANAQLAFRNHHQGMMIGVFNQNTRAKALYTKLGAEFVKETTFTVDGIAYPDELLAFHNLAELAQNHQNTVE